MAWEERGGRRYYYRKVRRGGRVFSVYEGNGLSGGAVVAAVDKLVALLRCGNPRAEVQAARTILSLSDRLVERDLEERVNALEKGFPAL